MKGSLPLLLVLAAASLGGCGASGTVEKGPADAPLASARPDAPPPDPHSLGGDAPPPAWIETSRGSTWLGYASYCWGDTCADAVPPECGEPYAPYVDVDPAEVVTVHLGFRARTARLVHFAAGEAAAAPDEEPLEPGRVVEWAAAREGPFWLSTWVGGGRDASYAACLRFATDPLTVAEALDHGSGDVAVRGTLYVENGRTWLCDALAESYPPQCPGSRLALRGAERLGAHLAREGEIAWGEEPTTVRGTLGDATLVVAER